MNRILFSFLFKNEVKNLSIFFNEQEVPNITCQVSVIFDKSYKNPKIILDTKKITFQFENAVVEIDKDNKIPLKRITGEAQRACISELIIIDKNYDNNYDFWSDLLNYQLEGDNTLIELGFNSVDSIVEFYLEQCDDEFVEIVHIDNYSTFFCQIYV